MAIKSDKNEKRQTPKSLNYNIYTMYIKIKALNEHTGSKKNKNYDTVRPNVVIVVAFNSFFKLIAITLFAELDTFLILKQIKN